MSDTDPSELPSWVKDPRIAPLLVLERLIYDMREAHFLDDRGLEELQDILGSLIDRSKHVVFR